MQFTLPRFRISNRGLLILGVTLLLLIFAHPTFASNTSGGGLPFDDWFTKIRQSITGPFAFTASILGLVGTGATLIFSGGDLNAVMRTLIYVVLVLCFVVAAQNTIAAITGQGAEITALSNALADRLQARLA